MTRDLIIQIRVSKDELSTISAQADREGLAVSTYLRALALRSAIASENSPRGRAMAALQRIHARSVELGTDKLSEKQIEAEIKAARAASRRR